MNHQKERIWAFEVMEVVNNAHFGFIIIGDLKPSGESLSVGERLTFTCPDGRVVSVPIKSFPLINHLRWKAEGLTPIELPKTKDAEHITVGAQVFKCPSPP